MIDPRNPPPSTFSDFLQKTATGEGPVSTPNIERERTRHKRRKREKGRRVGKRRAGRAS